MNYLKFVFLIGFLSLMAFTSQNKYEKETINSIKDLFKKMHLIEGGELTIGITDFHRITENDSTLLAWNVPYRQTVNSFYISATEVTNTEYREFYLAMKDELGVERADELYYPDTLVWTKEFKYSSYEPMMRNYFYHPTFSNYPVIGISWTQTQDYCKWKTQVIRNLAKGREELMNLTFRLPTQNEWERAAYNPIKNPSEVKQLYPWKRNRYKEDGKYLANFGEIKDENKATVKVYAEDGSLYTSAVGYYPSSYWGLYDMAGNAAEWVSDTATIYDDVKEKLIYKLTDIDSLIQSMENKLDAVSYNFYYKGKLIHDKELLSKGDMKLVKGGAWCDGLAYLQIGSKEAMDKEKKSCRVGFRVAISYDQKYEKYFPKKYWKPKK